MPLDDQQSTFGWYKFHIGFQKNLPKCQCKNSKEWEPLWFRLRFMDLS